MEGWGGDAGSRFAAPHAHAAATATRMHRRGIRERGGAGAVPEAKIKNKGEEIMFRGGERRESR